MAMLTHEGRKRLAQIIMDVSNAWSIRLHTGVPLTVSSMAIDVNEAFFSGYSSKALSHGAVTVTAEGIATCEADAVTFSHNGGPTSQTATAWVIVDTGSGTLICYRTLDPAITFASAADTFSVTPSISLTQGT